MAAPFASPSGPLSAAHRGCADRRPALAGDAASAQLVEKLPRTRLCRGRGLHGRDLAADAALRSCRGEENAYLAALSDSPLLDADDIAQARPDLVARARAALLETVSGPRAVLR